MLVTLLGILTLSNPLQPEKAEVPMLVTLLGISTLFNPLQPAKAASPMLVTPLGISTLFNPLQPTKAASPMLVTLHCTPPIVTDEGIVMLPCTLFSSTPTTLPPSYLSFILT